MPSAVPIVKKKLDDKQVIYFIWPNVQWRIQESLVGGGYQPSWGSGGRCKPPSGAQGAPLLMSDNYFHR